MGGGSSRYVGIISEAQTLYSSTSMNTHLAARLQHLVSAYPPHTALFYARIWHTLAPATDSNHDSLHALALAFLQAAEPYSAIHLVRDHTGLDNLDLDLEIRFERSDKVCGGCAIIVSRCCEKLGRYSEGQAVLARALKRGANISTFGCNVDGCRVLTLDRLSIACTLVKCCSGISTPGQPLTQV